MNQFGNLRLRRRDQRAAHAHAFRIFRDFRYELGADRVMRNAVKADGFDGHPVKPNFGARRGDAQNRAHHRVNASGNTVSSAPSAAVVWIQSRYDRFHVEIAKHFAELHRSFDVSAGRAHINGELVARGAERSNFSGKIIRRAGFDSAVGDDRRPGRLSPQGRPLNLTSGKSFAPRKPLRATKAIKANPMSELKIRRTKPIFANRASTNTKGQYVLIDHLFAR